MKKFSVIPLLKKSAPLLLLAVFLLPLSAHSETRAGSLEVSPFAGYTFFDNAHNLNNRGVYGGRLGYNMTDRFGIEAVGGFIKSSVDDTALTQTHEGQFTSPIDGVKITNYHLDLLYNFMPESTFNPFIAAGYGANHYKPEINSNNMAVFNFGVGAKLWLAESFALRIDLRDNMVYDERLHNIETTLGVVFAFGGTKKAAEPVAAAVAVAAAPADSDRDGVTDALDKCPGTPAGVTVDKNGCPPALKKVVILASEPKAAEKIKVAAVEPALVVLAFEDVHFDFDKSTLTPAAEAILKRNVLLLKENPRAKIRIAGYTSASGTEEYNQKLSERRAEAVKAFLVKEGVVMTGRLSTVGYGEANPVAYEAAPKDIYSEAAKANIRVLFEVIVE
jgi:OOP family OmpA-OmpF porin